MLFIILCTFFLLETVTKGLNVLVSEGFFFVESAMKRLKFEII